MMADLMVVPEDPLHNLKVLYGTGFQKLDSELFSVLTLGLCQDALEVVNEYPRSCGAEC